MALLAVPLVSLADDLATARTNFGFIFEDLAQQPDYWIEATGTETLGSTVHTLADYVSVSTRTTIETSGPVKRVFVESLSYRDGNLVRRFVADGRNSWDFDGTGNVYRVMRYGDSLSQSYRDVLGALVRSRATGPSALLMQTLDQGLTASLSGSSVVASKWLPFFSSSTVVVDGSAKTITCSVGGQSPSEAVYLWSSDLGGDPFLLGMSFSQTKASAAGSLVTDWQATVHRGEMMPSVDYSFNPTGLRVVSVNLRQGG